jgi:hypothetical protein
MHESRAGIIRVFVVEFVDGDRPNNAQCSLDDLRREVGLDNEA